MKFEDAKRIVEKIHYKPNFKFELKELTHLILFEATIHFKADSNNPDRTIDLHLRRLLRERSLNGMTEQHFIQWVGSKLHEIEIHEFREWFKYDGVNVYNPHPELMNDQIQT